MSRDGGIAVHMRHLEPVGNLEKPLMFMLRQAQHERKRLILLKPFALSLSKCEVFRDTLLGLRRLSKNIIPLRQGVIQCAWVV